MRCDPRGSNWRRWDLHFHTPASYDYRGDRVSPLDLVDKLIAAGVEVVAVTDHHVIDVISISAMQARAADRLTVLPGIELRCELGGSKSVHYIGIFPEYCDLVDVWTKLQGRLDISPADVARSGDERIFVPYEKGCKTIRDLGGLVSAHAGKKTSSIEEIGNAQEFKQAFKAELVRELVDILEVGKVSDCQDYRDIVFPNIEKQLPLILCSDNHTIVSYSTKCPLWIKADPGFLGLLQIVNEPDTRVYLGDVPPAVTRVRQGATKYLGSVSFTKTDVLQIGEHWFDGEVPLNHGLIAIIGNKGGGKSALADVIALLGYTQNSAHFSFLNKGRFLHPKLKLGSMFKATARWHSGREVTRQLDEPADVTTVPESVKYIPQGFLETICSELKLTIDSRFDRELKDVIFSHVGEADRLERENLDDLIAYQTSEAEARIQQITADIGKLNVEIVDLEEKSTPEYRSMLGGVLSQRQAELETHDVARPAEVLPPATDPKAQASTRSISAKLEELSRTIKDTEAEIAIERKSEREAALKVAAADKLLSKIANLERQRDAFLADAEGEASLLGLDLRELVRLQVDNLAIQAARVGAESTLKKARQSLDAGIKDSLASILANHQVQAEELRGQLDEPNRRYQAYLQALAAWRTKRDAIEGSSELHDSLKGLEARLKELDQLPTHVAELEEKRCGLTREVFGVKEQLLTKYRELYAPVQEFIENHPISKQHGALEFKASIAVERLVEGLLEMIHQGRKGSFSGEMEGQRRLRELVDASDIATADGTIGFLENVLDHLLNDHRESPLKPVRLTDQLLQDFTPCDLYDFLFSLDYLRPRFELRWQGKAIDQLSPGERGNLLLVFYLLIDKRDNPLIIDQPEENLDNQTIVKMLVPCIKDAKERRQIIIVTHNPNLAVVCDADQVIHARLDKSDGNRLYYTTGAIENPKINQTIIDVLEGTKPAFDLRDAKYGVVERAL